MKKAVWLAAFIVLAGNTFAQSALPDLKVELKPIGFKKTRVPIYIDQSNNFRLSPGDVVTISVEISNNGQAASGPFTLEVVLDDYFENPARSKTFSKNFADLKPGERASFEQDLLIDIPEGAYNAKIHIVTMVKDDWNTSDNYVPPGTILYWQKKFVDDYLRPDLVVELTSPDFSRHLTLPVRLLAVVTNKGHAVSPATDLVLECKGKDVKKKVVPPLKPGESFKHEFQHKWYSLGSKKCVAKVNLSKPEKGRYASNSEIRQNKFRFDEPDYSNNDAELTVYIK